MTRLHVDEVCPKGTTYPLFISFLNGQSLETLEKPECLILDNKKTGLKSAVTEINGILYIGDEANNSLNKTFIVRRNKKTGKVRVLEAGAVNLAPRLNKDEDKPVLVDNNNLELSRKFGSKKHKQIAEQRERLRVNEDTIKEQMLNATSNISEDTLDLSAYNTGNSEDFYVPTIDRNAEKVEDVYKIDLILTEEQFDKIYSEIEDKEYIADLSDWIKDIVKKKLPKKYTVLAIYADALIKLYSTMAKEITKKTFTIYPHSTTLNEIILSKFTSLTNNKRSRPAPYKDKTLCHAIVFLLLIHNYKFDITQFCETAKLSPNTAALKMKVAGASVSTVGGKKIVQLKLPLPSKSNFRRKSAKF